MISCRPVCPKRVRVCVDGIRSSRREMRIRRPRTNHFFLDNLACAGTERLSLRSILCQADRPCACPLLSRYPCRCRAWFPFGSLTGVPEIRFLLAWGVASFPLGVWIAAA